MTDKISGEDSSRGGRWQRCGTTGIDTEVEEIRDDNRRCGTTGMAKWVGRTATEWANIDR